MEAAAAEQRHQEPPKIAALRPRSGVVPEAMAIAIDNGSATMATVSPETMSARNASKRRSLAQHAHHWREQFREGRLRRRGVAAASSVASIISRAGRALSSPRGRRLLRIIAGRCAPAAAGARRGRRPRSACSPISSMAAR